MRRAITFCALLAGTSFTSFGQINWDFSTPTPTGNVGSGSTVDSFVRGNNNGASTPMRSAAEPSTGYTGASGGMHLSAAAFTGGFDPEGSTYFEIILTPDNSNSVVVTGISFAHKSEVTGPQAFGIYSDATNSCIPTTAVNTCLPLAAGTIINNDTWVYTGLMPVNIIGLAGQPVIIRIYGFNGAGTATPNEPNFSIDDMTFTTSPLPVRLVDFNASVTNTGVALTWQTADESNISAIEVEKSDNGVEFSPLTAVPAQNGIYNEYAYNDYTTAHTSYYRLKMVEKAGSATYSPIVMAKKASVTDADISLHPNPAGSTITLSNLAGEDPADVTVYATDGRVVLSTIVTAATSASVDIASLPEGAYILRLQQGSVGKTIPFVKR